MADVSFRIEPVEVVGFLGPDGAGKTTTLKCLAGVLHPSAGSVRVRAGRAAGTAGPADQAGACTLSLGDRMRCELAASLLHRAAVLFLDEPTLGLDVAGQAAIREFVGAYNRAPAPQCC